jgi:hypothetical protein
VVAPILAHWPPGGADPLRRLATSIPGSRLQSSAVPRGHQYPEVRAQFPSPPVAVGDPIVDGTSPSGGCPSSPTPRRNDRQLESASVLEGRGRRAKRARTLGDELVVRKRASKTGSSNGFRLSLEREALERNEPDGVVVTQLSSGSPTLGGSALRSRRRAERSPEQLAELSDLLRSLWTIGVEHGGPRIGGPSTKA